MVDRLKRLARATGVVAVARSWRRATVTRRDPQHVWEQGRAREVAFWERVLPGRLAMGGLYMDASSAQPRAVPQAPITDAVMCDLLDRIPGPAVAILDVGAGPLTAVGKTHPGKTLQITATDPLADDYDRILDELGFDPPVRTIGVRGEDLLDRFEAGGFDIAFARNSIDHAADPVEVIRTMLALVKPGRFVVLWHLPAEGERWRYHGLHQWNFAYEDCGLVIRRPRRGTVRVDDSLDAVAAAESSLRSGWIGCVLTKAEDPT